MVTSHGCPAGRLTDAAQSRPEGVEYKETAPGGRPRRENPATVVGDIAIPPVRGGGASQTPSPPAARRRPNPSGYGGSPPLTHAGSARGRTARLNSRYHRLAPGRANQGQRPYRWNSDGRRIVPVMREITTPYEQCYHGEHQKADADHSDDLHRPLPQCAVAGVIGVAVSARMVTPRRWRRTRRLPAVRAHPERIRPRRAQRAAQQRK